MRKAIGEVEGGRGIAKQATGIDFTTDISDATVFVQLTPKGDLELSRGRARQVHDRQLDKIATMSHRKATPAGAGAWVETDDKTAVGVTKDHVLLAGTTPWCAIAWRTRGRRRARGRHEPRLRGGRDRREAGLDA